MSASLVGSEMCIRDRLDATTALELIKDSHTAYRKALVQARRAIVDALPAARHAMVASATDDDDASQDRLQRSTKKLGSVVIRALADAAFTHVDNT
eukprot:3703821-Alexandrium_andersonii.AAC.1